jgi:hypothetical protein
MSWSNSVREELKRSPIAVVATLAGVMLSALALLVAWLQYAGQPTISSPAAAPVSSKLHVSNLLVVAAFFLAATFSLASAVRFLARVHPFAALVLSVVAAVLSSFCTMVLFSLAPPKQLGSDALDLAKDTVFYGTAFVFVALNGLPVLQTLAEPDYRKLPPTPGKNGKNGEGGAMLFVALLVLIFWGSLVSSGLSKLVQLFLK